MKSFTVPAGGTVSVEYKANTMMVTGHNSLSNFRGLYYLISASAFAPIVDASGLNVSVSESTVTIVNNGGGTCNCAFLRGYISK